MQISAKGLTFTYNAKSALSSHALRGVEVTVPSGSFFGIIGKIKENGAHSWWVIVFSLLLILIAMAVYFFVFKKQETGCNEDELFIASSNVKE